MLSKKIASSLVRLIAIFVLVFVASSAKAQLVVQIPNDTRIPREGYLVIAKDIAGSGIAEPKLLYNLIEVSGLPDLKAFLFNDFNGGIIDVVGPEKVVISEILWGSDASLSTSSDSQWIELKNKSGKSLLTGNGNYRLIFYPANETPPAKGADGSLPSGVTDRVGTITDEGIFWSIASKGQSGRSGLGTEADTVVPTVPIISMYRVTDAAGEPMDGNTSAAWKRSTPPALNFDITEGVNRIGSPGADRPFTTALEADTKTAAIARIRTRLGVTHCGLGWAPHSQYPPPLEQPKVMIYALEFELNPNGYTCSAIEIRTGDATISDLAGWHLYLGTFYNPSLTPIVLTQENSQITDNVLKLTPELLGQQTFTCSNAYLYGKPLPSVNYDLKNENNITIDRAYSCYLWGQNAFTLANGVWVKSRRRISGEALQSMDIPRIERYIMEPAGVFIRYTDIEKFKWDHLIPSDWLLASSEETRVAGGKAPSSPYKKLTTSWAVLKQPKIHRRNAKRR